MALLVVKHSFESLFFHDHKIVYIRYEIRSYSEIVQYFHLSVKLQMTFEIRVGSVGIFSVMPYVLSLFYFFEGQQFLQYFWRSLRLLRYRL